MRLIMTVKRMPHVHVILFLSFVLIATASARGSSYAARHKDKECNQHRNILCSGKCVALNSICDEVADCPDGADEILCHQMQVSLKGGVGRGEGRVELKISNITGTICSDRWDDRDAKVICRMLGFKDVSKARASRAYHGTVHDEGEGVIWMNRLACKGHENHINDCRGSVWGEHRCSHKQDAGVICLPKASTTITTTTAPTKATIDFGASPSTRTTTLSSSLATTDEPTTFRDETCGKRHIHPTMHKIIGGMSSTYGSHPWMARVMVLVRDRAYHLCGGTIIADRWILTAAHCFAKEKNNIIVKVGDHNLVTRDDHEQVFVVDKIFIHESFPELTTSAYDNEDDNLLYDVTDYDDYNYNEEDDLPGFRFNYFDFFVTSLFDSHFNKPRRTFGAALLKGDIALLRLEAKISSKGYYKRESSTENKKKYQSTNVFENLRSRKNRNRRRKNKKTNKINCTTTAATPVAKETFSMELPDATSTKKHLTKKPVTVSAKRSKFSTSKRPTISTAASSTKPSKTDQKSTQPLKKPETTKRRPFIQFNHYVQPACLPSASTTYEAGMKCEVTGWGLIDEDSLTPPNSLHSAILPIINETECKRLYKDLFKLFVTEDSFCAGYATGEVDTCSGDSGGPLICNIDGVHTLMGVTSRGNGCANKNSPGIYAKVANFISWIEETISKYDHF